MNGTLDPQECDEYLPGEDGECFGDVYAHIDQSPTVRLCAHHATQRGLPEEPAWAVPPVMLCEACKQRRGRDRVGDRWVCDECAPTTAPAR